MNPPYLKAEGNFRGEAFKPENGWFTRSKEKQTPAIQVGLRVVDDVSEDGKIIIWNGWLSEKAYDNTIRTLVDCFGFDGDLEALYDGRTSFEGLPCEFTTEAEEYEGKSRVKVKWLNAPGYSRKAPALADEDAKAIVALFGKKAKAVAVEHKAATASGPALKTDKPKPAPAPVAAKVGPDDDVPF